MARIPTRSSTPTCASSATGCRSWPSASPATTGPSSSKTAGPPSGPDAAQPVAQGAGVLLVDQEPLGDQEAGVRRPGVGREPPFPADVRDVVAVKDLAG